MEGQSSDDLLAMFDSAPLNRRYWLSFGLLSAITVLGIETHGRAIEDIGEAEAAPRQTEVALGAR